MIVTIISMRVNPDCPSDLETKSIPVNPPAFALSLFPPHDPPQGGRALSHHLPAQGFADGGIDWVFLDANHGYEGMKQDLEAYYAKVKPGGYITGHDYTNVKGYGVIQAVNEFVKSHPVHMVALSTDEYPSFILRKGLPGQPSSAVPAPAPRSVRSVLAGTPLCPGVVHR